MLTRGLVNIYVSTDSLLCCARNELRVKRLNCLVAVTTFKLCVEIVPEKKYFSDKLKL